MALGKDYATQSCSLARTLELVGERWTLLIIRDAFYGVRRYNDFLVHLAMPRAVLSTRLRTLTEGRVLETVRYQASPPRDEYSLTAKGRQLWPAVYALVVWGEQHHGSERGSRRDFLHAACATRLDAAGRCPACEVGVPPQDIEMRPGPGADPEPEDAVSRALQRPRMLLEPLPQPLNT
ncbi:helix-turn-helix transcriptional regulator [Streptomyces bathyalis]|uniref:Helix-turn-helix transcriptional regulator n=1 Tax=Streptomyces bathyalis TaxID=2710756 RepID=A0A7T1T951_9ACTN|nr:helix-turn-helix domain-containing protein [Streptomyces bathyalis]QPP08638.1 helix-turn-helix transcriptional regulator [Streptomyces bathyalis]